jgi:hypothetical protein
MATFFTFFFHSASAASISHFCTPQRDWYLLTANSSCNSMLAYWSSNGGEWTGTESFFHEVFGFFATDHLIAHESSAWSRPKNIRSGSSLDGISAGNGAASISCGFHGESTNLSLRIKMPTSSSWDFSPAKSGWCESKHHMQKPNSSFSIFCSDRCRDWLLLMLLPQLQSIMTRTEVVVGITKSGLKLVTKFGLPP